MKGTIMFQINPQAEYTVTDYRFNPWVGRNVPATYTAAGYAWINSLKNGVWLYGQIMRREAAKLDY